MRTLFMGKGVYYVPEYNFIILIKRAQRTLYVDYNSLGGVVWKCLIDDGTQKGVCYLEDTNKYVYIGEL